MRGVTPRIALSVVSSEDRNDTILHNTRQPRTAILKQVCLENTEQFK